MVQKILIIEDEKILLDLLKKKLTDENYEVSIARDGEEGLRVMKKIKPDLVLLDIVMPKMDGFGVMEAMIKDKKLKNIPVVIVSNSGQSVELDRAQRLGAKDWLVKTEFDPLEVVKKVKKHINSYL
jgi:two-component system, chemotaxis family, chemotaxis protein CheY